MLLLLRTTLGTEECDTHHWIDWDQRYGTSGTACSVPDFEGYFQPCITVPTNDSSPTDHRYFAGLRASGGEPLASARADPRHKEAERRHPDGSRGTRESKTGIPSPQSSTSHLTVLATPVVPPGPRVQASTSVVDQRSVSYLCVE